jgi:tol-pal system beta propeller repeat protein TolB
VIPVLLSALVIAVLALTVFVVLRSRADAPSGTDADTGEGAPIHIPAAIESVDALARPKGDPVPAATIVFTHEDAGRWNLWLVEADGTNPRALTHEQAVRAELPALSPDRRTIAYTSVTDSKVWDLYLIDTSGEKPLRVARDLAADARATWSPDGRQLAYVSEQGGQKDLVAVNLHTNQVRRLTDNADEEGDPSWSPDGSRIAYWSGQDLYTVPTSGGAAPTRLTSAEGQEADPAWSPDGTRLAYAAKATRGSWDVWVARADGSGGAPLRPGAATAAGDEADPTWSPDGGRIAFETKRDAQIANPATDDSEIYVVNADGSKPVRLTRFAGYDGHPAWGTPSSTSPP